MNKAEMNIVGVLNMSFKKVMLIGLTGLLVTACESDKSTKLQDSLDKDSTVDVISTLNFGESVIPFPNNILFIDALGMPPADGTLQIPVADETALADPSVAMNALDGFSTVAPISTGFSGALDDTSFAAGVKMYEVTRNASGAVISVDREMTFGTEFVATLSSIDTTMSTLVILPLQPLKPKQTYMPVVTKKRLMARRVPILLSAGTSLRNRRLMRLKRHVHLSLQQIMCFLASVLPPQQRHKVPQMFMSRLWMCLII